MKKKTAAALFALLALCAPAAAQEPVEITARKAIEWDRAAQTYTATGGVVATKGAARVAGDTLTARYAGKDGAGDITQITVTGNVVISSPPYRAYGDRGVYDVATGDAMLTGRDLRVETETERLTARDGIAFRAAQNTLTALGGATAVKGEQTLSADTLTAHFTQGPDGKRATDRITASGNILITTARERVTGATGVYDVPAGRAELAGGVRITQGDNVLEGERATVDMRTGLSRLFAKENGDGRVKGVFYPKSRETDVP